MQRRRLLLAAGLPAAVAVMMLAAGCGSSSSSGPSALPPLPTPTPAHHHHTATPTPTPVPTTTVTVTASPTPTTPTSSTTGDSCHAGHLSLSLGPGDGAAGTTYQPVILTNTGSASCTLYGHPGVSFVDSSGALIGVPSAEDPGKKKTVTLAAGGAAYALLRQPEPGNFPTSACHSTKANRLRVYPPGSKKALFVADTVTVCTTSQGRTGISTMRAGTGS